MLKETRKVLILGATGQIGKALFEGFKKNPLIEVIGSTRRSNMNPLLVAFDPFKDDWKTLDRTDILINCIGQIKETEGCDFQKIHVGMTENILTHRSALGNPRIIQVSALGADKNHEVTFLRTKGQADEMLLKEHDTYVVRPSIVCSPGTMLVKKFRMMKKMIRLLNKNLLVPNGFLETKIQPVMIGDFVEAIQRICLIKPDKRTLEIAGPERICFLELTKMFEQFFQSTIKITELNEGIVRRIVKHLISPLLPQLINYDQYRLLFSDNVSHSDDLEKILERKPLSTMEFWRSELI